MNHDKNAAEFNLVWKRDREKNAALFGLTGKCLAFVAVFFLVFLLTGCQTLREIGEVVAGGDRDPLVVSDAESIVAGVEAVQPFLPFPVRETIAALLSGLGVYAVVSKKKGKELSVK